MRSELFVLLAVTACIAGEMVFLEDLNNDHSTRNLDMGLPETLKFKLRHSNGDLDFHFQENRRLNVRAPMFYKENGNFVQVKTPTVMKTKFYQDKRNGAYVMGNCEAAPHGPCTRKLTGNIHINGQEYKLEPAAVDKRNFNPSLGVPHFIEKLERQNIASRTVGNTVVAEINDAIPHPAEVNHDVVEAKDEALHGQKEEMLEDLLERLEKLKTLKKRSAKTTHGIELLLALDHKVWEKFSELYTNEADIQSAIREYFSHIVNGVDLRYITIDDPTHEYYITFAGFYMAKTEADSEWMDYSSNQPDAGAGLSYMREWVKKEGLVEHDHAALISGADVYYQGGSGTAGLAYLNGVCNSYKVSVNEEMGFFEGAFILAHELGHNLGSSHDSGSGDCNPSLKYVMAPYVASVSRGSTNIEPWRFSSCSINQFNSYVDGMGGASCTLNKPQIYDETEFFEFTDDLAGAEYTANEQCEVLYGDGATQCTSNANTADVCRNFQCRLSGSTCYGGTVAAMGTPCGPNKMCFDGLCQDVECKGRSCDDDRTTSSTATPQTTTPDDTFVCYNAGIAGFSCPELKDLLGSAKALCKSFARDCCKTCTAKFLCKKEKVVKLGKKKLSCSSLVEQYGKYATCTLFTSSCCKTCSSDAN